VKAGGRGRLLRLVLETVAGKARDADALDVLHAEAATIETRVRHIPVACDGEVRTLDAPLEYRIRPSALEVFVPGD
jgi:diacylglycerol kinase family enzyme